MRPIFSVVLDVATSTVRITMAGFFDRLDIDRLVETVTATHARLQCSRNQHMTLVDIRGMKIQKKESVEAFAHVLSQPALASRKLAFVVGPTLARAQIQRAAASRGAMFFPSLEEAEQWLREQRSMVPPSGQPRYGERSSMAAAPRTAAGR